MPTEVKIRFISSLVMKTRRPKQQLMNKCSYISDHLIMPHLYHLSLN